MARKGWSPNSSLGWSDHAVDRTRGWSTMNANPGGAGDFNPDDYGTPLWDMDAAQGVEEASGDPCEDGDSVLNYLDQSATGADYDQTTGAKKPTFHTNVVNGRPVVRFDGIDDYLEPANSANFGAITAFTGIWIFRCVRDKTQYIHTYLHDATNREILLVVSNTNVLRFYVYTADGGKTVDSTVDVSNWVVVTGTVAQNGAHRLWVNNQLEDEDAVGVFANEVNVESAIGGIIANGNPVFEMEGDIARMVYYGTVLSEANRSAATLSAMTHYGVS